MEADTYEAEAVSIEGFLASLYDATLSAPGGVQVVLVESVRSSCEQSAGPNNPGEGHTNEAAVRPINSDDIAAWESVSFGFRSLGGCDGWQDASDPRRSALIAP